MSQLIIDFSNWIWGYPLLIFLLIANITLAIYSHFLPLTGLVHGIRIIFKKHISDSPDSISPFQALCNGLAATIGLGNISGVAVAVTQGGAGAIFWMWVAAIFGMNTKFFEVLASYLYRGRDIYGNTQGGAMYALPQVFPKYGKILSLFFCVAGIVGTLSLFQMNQLASYVNHVYFVPKHWFGLILCIIIIYVLQGGLKRLTSLTQKLVPLMSLLYLVLIFGILFYEFERIPWAFEMILKSAFSGESFIGGVSGYALAQVIQTGIRRSIFSNEAGVGTEPIAHSHANVSEPVQEGFVAMLGPCWDTLFICTLTGLAVIVGLDGSIYELQGINITAAVFKKYYSQYGDFLLTLCVSLFSFTTMVGMSNYNRRIWDYLFASQSIWSHRIFIGYFCSTLFFAAISELKLIMSLVDICYALMCIPNIILTLKVASEIRMRLIDYKKRFSL